ncbi:hypothetical protein FEF65_03865 [Mariprofundus erugo]|uniref:Uncharacterized protein n=1 Tax=Mariprofundus erugo TaxID=2528639 RepID=A0A5R9GVZ9_9PROT|nr:hypothetical protein [Mariprofundus erugo]TLS68142.1 hypothetical protein FEF65_03865 [Mariprofundus erugo]
MRRAAIPLLVLLLAGCGSSKTDIMFECPSPSGAKIATLYRITSGDAPGDQEMRVNIRKAGSELDTDMVSFAFRHGYDAIIHWNSEQQIIVEYPADAELTHQEPAVFGTSQSFSATDSISMSYQETPSTHGYFMVEKRCFNQP